ncbi:MAG: sulfotransferase, partial [Myxococcota bacterium]
AINALEASASFHLYHVNRARALRRTLDESPPGSAIACREIGQTWRTLHDFPRAIAWFTRAGALEPRDVDTWETLASCHEQNREPTKARQIADATRMRFGLTAGIERLLVRLDHHDEHLEEARRRGERLLAEPLLPSMRRSLHLELAAVAQRQGDVAATWEHAQAGNRLAQAEFTQQGLLPGVFTASVRHVVDQARTVFANPVPPSDGRLPPTFVVGVPRAGTTLVQQMLQAHPRIETLDETDPGSRVLRRHWAEHSAITPLAYPDQLRQISPEAWVELRDAYWSAVAEDGVEPTLLASDVDPVGTRLVDKLPLSLVRLQYFRQLFPDALVVVCLRDPRDLVWSNVLQDFSANPFAAEATDLARAADLVAATLDLWLAWRDDPPMRTIELRYEDVTADPEASMRRVLDGMGLAWDPAVAAPHLQVARPIRTPSYLDVGKPIHKGAQARWRKVLPYLEPVLEPLAPYVEAFGYEPTPARVS